MPKFFALTNLGLPLSGGMLYTYVAGTSTPKATYTDSTGVTPNANPVILDSAGRADVWLALGAYKFVLQDSLGNTIWTVDGINQTNLTFNVVDTLADLRALDPNSAALVTVLGYAAIGDGGGGNFYWNSGISTADDNGVIICPTGYGGVGR